MQSIINSPHFIAATLFGVAISVTCPCLVESGYERRLEAGHDHRVDTDSRLSGASLENRLWEAIQLHHIEELAELVSPIFLGGTNLGFTGHTSEISNLLNLHIQNFSIVNVSETQSDDIRIVAYQLIAHGQTPLNDRRVSVWQKTKHKHHQYFWQLISHSVL